MRLSRTIPEQRLRGIIIAAALGLTASTGCGLDDFEEEIIEEITIPASPMIGNPFDAEGSAGLNNLQLSAAKNFQNQGVTPGDVDAIFVKSIRMEVVLPAGAPDIVGHMDNYLTQVEFFVESPGVPRESLGTLDNVPMELSADLAVNTALNLKPYAVAESMKIGAEITLKQEPAINVTFRTILTLLIDINLLEV